MQEQWHACRTDAGYLVGNKDTSLIYTITVFILYIALVCAYSFEVVLRYTPPRMYCTVLQFHAEKPKKNQIQKPHLTVMSCMHPSHL